MTKNAIPLAVGAVTVMLLFEPSVLAQTNTPPQNLTVTGNLDVVGGGAIRGNSLSIGSWDADNTQPGVTYTYIDSTVVDTSSLLKLTGNRPQFDWLWEHVAADQTPPVPVMKLDSNHRLSLFSSSDPTTPVIVLDAENGVILVNGVEVGGSSFTSLSSPESVGVGITPLSVTYGNNGAVSFGCGCYLGGDWAATFGCQTNASGWSSIAMGYYTGAMNARSLAGGSETWVYSTESIGFGDHVNVTGNQSLGTGSYTTASGLYSTAMGQNTVASGQGAIATGHGTSASSDWTTALGLNSAATAWASTAMGNGTLASGGASTAMGNHTTAQGYAQTVVGQYNVIQGTSASWISSANEPAFIVGNGVDAQHPSNAFVVMKNGDTKISGAVVINPQGDLPMGAFTSGTHP